MTGSTLKPVGNGVSHQWKTHAPREKTANGTINVSTTAKLTGESNDVLCCNCLEMGMTIYKVAVLYNFVLYESHR
jgi:hypothetical protein